MPMKDGKQPDTPYSAQKAKYGIFCFPVANANTGRGIIMTGKRKIIDAHAHIFPGKIAQRASESIREFYHLNMGFAGYPHTLVERGSKIGVYKYLVCSTATKPEQVFSINNFIAEKCKKYPEFFGFGSLHPRMEKRQFVAEIERIKQLGLHGIKLHSDFQQFNIDDPEMVPVYRLAAKAGLPILFHMGDSRYDYSAPHRLARAATEVPELICIAAHYGGYERWDEAYQYLKLPNVYFDTSSSLFKLSKSDALALMEHMGIERFFFGTDFPMWEHETELERFLSLGLCEEDNEKVLHGNFERVFGITD